MWSILLPLKPFPNDSDRAGIFLVGRDFFKMAGIAVIAQETLWPSPFVETAQQFCNISKFCGVVPKVYTIVPQSKMNTTKILDTDFACKKCKNRDIF